MALSAIWKMNLHLIKNGIRSISRHSSLKVAVVGIFVVGLWVGSFLFLYNAFSFIKGFPGVGMMLMDRLLFILFFAWFFMLILSNILVSFSAHYKSKETQLLFTSPLRYSEVFIYKLAQTMVLSSWASLFLSGPLVLAYGIIKGLGWDFYLTFLIFIMPFFVLAAAIGSLIALVLVRYFPRFQFRKIAGLLAIIGLAGLVVYYKFSRPSQVFGQEVALVMSQLLAHTAFCKYPLLPSYWVVQGLMCAAGGSFKMAIFYFLVLLSNCLIALQLCLVLVPRIYFSSWSQAVGAARTKDYSLGGGILGRIEPLLRIFRPSTRALLIKDAKLFWRDPSQWSQFVIFFGFLGVYFMNLRSSPVDIDLPFWKNLICFLNLGAVCLTAAMLSTRFVFPLMSLEGKRFWIVGLGPIQMSKLLLEKFWMSVIGLVLVTTTLIFLSGRMLRLSGWMLGLCLATTIMVSFGISGLTVGLSIIFPNFKAESPADIVAGFGGTMVFVLSLLYLGLLLGTEVLPIHLYFTKQAISYDVFVKSLASASIGALGLTLSAAILPMALGLKALKRMEF